MVLPLVDDCELIRGPAAAEEPRVSVVVPAYQPTWIDPSLDSVRSQTYRDFELIVVDDGSPEPVWPAQTDDLVLVRQANTGAGGARNRGVSLARGEFVAFLDSDDTWLPHKLETQLAAHDAHPGWVISTTDQRLRFGADVLVESGLARYGLAGPVVSFERLFQENCLITSSVMLRRATYLQVGGMDPRFRACQDYACWLRVALLGEVGVLHEVLVERYERDSSITAIHRRRGSLYDYELTVYEDFLTEHPEHRRRGFVRDALARVEFDRGFHRLTAGDWAGARQALLRCLWHRPGRFDAWLALARAVLHIGQG